jgi:hypothetical protein
MKIKAVINQNRYAFAVFAMLGMLSVIYDGFSDVAVFVFKIILSAVISLFFAPYIKDENEQSNYVPIIFALLGIISCNVIFITADIHILLSLICFFTALMMKSKSDFLTAVFSGLCVAVQPLSLFYLVPTIILVKIVRKQKVTAIISTVLSVAVFVVTKFSENSEFYNEQFSSYYHSVHLIFFSKDHLQIITEYSVCSVVLIGFILYCCIRLIMNSKKGAGIGLIITTVISLYGYSMCSNKQNVIMILLPALVSVVALSDDDIFKKINSETESFFSKRKLLLFLMIAITVSIPVIIGTLPIESEIFSRSTFIIFREE